MSTYEKAFAAKDWAAHLLREAEVCGIGVAVMGEGEFGVKVNLSRETDILLPSRINGVPVVVEVVGDVRASAPTTKEQQPNER